MNFSLIQRLYAYRFLDDFILIYPLYQLMFAAGGLSIGQISALFVIWSAVSLAADVPTGVLADRYSRRKLLAVGQLIKGVGFACWMVAPNFWGYALGFTLWGIGSTFDSGTFQALLFDELKLVGRQKDYVRVQGRAQSFSLAGTLAATALAAPAIVLGYGGLLWLSIAATVLAAAVALSVPEAARQETTGDAGYFAELWAGIKEAVVTPALLNVIVLGGFLGAVFGSLEEYDPIYFQTLGVPLAFIPLAIAALILVTLVASLVAHWFENVRPWLFLATLGLGGLCLVGSGLNLGFAAAGLLAGFYFITKLLETIYDGRLQHGISSHRRATVTSVGGFLAEVMSIGLFAGFGAIAQTWGTMAAFRWCGALTVAVAAGYLALRLHVRVDEPSDVLVVNGTNRHVHKHE